MPATDRTPPRDTYESLMDATYRALAEDGYADLTLRTIAAEFDGSRSLIHYYYESKDDLLAAFLGSLLDEFEGEIDDDAPPRDRFDSLIDWVAYGPEDRPEYHRVLFELRAQAPHSPELAAQLRANVRRIRTALETAIADAVETGELPPRDPEATALLVLTAIDSARTTDYALGTDDTLDRTLDAIATLLLTDD